MTTFTYTRDIPDGPHNPSTDQGPMKVNTNSIDSLLAINHNSFGVTDGGKHLYIQMPDDLNPGIPTGAQEILLYNGLDGTHNLYFVPPSTLVPAGGIQMTRNEAPVLLGTGFSWLPGGIIVQWGTATKVTDGSVAFSPIFTAVPYSVQITVFEANNNRHFVSVKTTSTSGFTVSSRDASGNDESNTFFWIAIGK